MGFNGLRNKLLHYQNAEYQGGLQFHNSGLTIKEPLESKLKWIDTTQSHL
jgi:hypothetical protein